MLPSLYHHHTWTACKSANKGHAGSYLRTVATWAHGDAQSRVVMATPTSGSHAVNFLTTSWKNSLAMTPTRVGTSTTWKVEIAKPCNTDHTQQTLPARPVTTFFVMLLSLSCSTYSPAGAQLIETIVTYNRMTFTAMTSELAPAPFERQKLPSPATSATVSILLPSVLVNA